MTADELTRRRRDRARETAAARYTAQVEAIHTAADVLDRASAALQTYHPEASRQLCAAVLMVEGIATTVEDSLNG